MVQAAARPAEDRHFEPRLGGLTYTWVANGEYHSGFHPIREHSERRAEERISGGKGPTVVVRYSPTQPKTSVGNWETEHPFARGSGRILGPFQVLLL
jgi:hypothetical protein